MWCVGFFEFEFEVIVFGVHLLKLLWLCSGRGRFGDSDRLQFYKEVVGFSLLFSSPILIFGFFFIFGCLVFFCCCCCDGSFGDYFGFVVYVCSGSELAQIMEREALGTTAKPSVGWMRPPEAEIEGFFAAAEMRERKRFTDK